MPATYADLERMYDGPIPRDELARCVEPKAPRYTVAKSGPIRAARLLRDGETWLDVMASAGGRGDVVAALQRIADLLNQHGEG